MAAMLETPDHTTAVAPQAENGESVLVPRDLIERLQGELKFSKIKIEALSFEIARLNRWRFGQSSESLDAAGQVALFDKIVLDAGLENVAAQDERQPATLRTRRAVRQALPADLPCIEHHHEIEATVCACGASLKRIGEDASEQLDCVPAQFFMHRHMRGKYACPCRQTMRAAALPAQTICLGLPRRACSRRSSWPNTTTTRRSTARKKSTRARHVIGTS